MTVGERIKAVRLKSGLSQVDLAEKANISKQTLYKYENNIVTNIPLDKIDVIANILNISPGILMGWEKSESYKEGVADAKLIKKYHRLSEANKQVVLNLIDSLLSAQTDF